MQCISHHPHTRTEPSPLPPQPPQSPSPPPSLKSKHTPHKDREPIQARHIYQSKIHISPSKIQSAQTPRHVRANRHTASKNALSFGKKEEDAGTVPPAPDPQTTKRHPRQHNPLARSRRSQTGTPAPASGTPAHNQHVPPHGASAATAAGSAPPPSAAQPARPEALAGSSPKQYRHL
jgi:hypothetical protein